jgi:small-conductance mechanosensitive channel
MTDSGVKKVAAKSAEAVPPMFGRFAKISLAGLTVVLLVAVVFAWRTEGAMADLPELRAGTAGAQNKELVDETPWKTAQTLAALAVSQEEMVLAREAERLADHEVDQTFATALRAASLQQRTLTGEALALQQKVTQFTALVASDQAALTAIQNGPEKGSDDEQIAQAQLGLDQDQLTDAKGDLARASGDKRDEIQRQLSARETEMKKFDAQGTTGEVAAISTRRYRTLTGLLGAWREQAKRTQLILQAKAAAESDAKQLTSAHNALEAKSDTDAKRAAGDDDRLGRLKRMSLEHQLMALDDDRIATNSQLAQVYGRWATQVELQRKIVGHLLIVQVIQVLVVLLLSIVVSAAVNRWLEHGVKDVRRVRTLGWIARLGVQVVALVVLLVMVFGPPNQVSTALGLVTAGLTVALQDFILAFVGWFILMGKGGIGVGDIVEINGVQGEVIDIGLFRTTLLETGNWASTGHPTGRRVAFNNKFAISGQYFNFRTAGQWMWDEFKVTVPSGEDTAATVARVENVVKAETEADSRQAEREWQQVSSKHGLSQYSAEPAVNARPAGAGIELVVRYVTRATDRFERRNKLAQSVLDALRADKPELEGVGDRE